MKYKRFTVLAVLFCVCLIASNLFEIKIFQAGPLTLTGGFLIFPVSYIINDCLSEVYGYSRTRFVIYLAFCVNLLFVLACQLVRILPDADYSVSKEHFDYIFTADVRITAASMLAFLCGSIMNAKVMVKMKERNGDKGFGWRAVVSSLVGESADSLVFFPIAFWGVGFRNMLVLMVTQIVLKTMYEVVVLPLTARIVKRLGASSDPEGL